MIAQQQINGGINNHLDGASTTKTHRDSRTTKETSATRVYGALLEAMAAGGVLGSHRRCGRPGERPRDKPACQRCCQIHSCLSVNCIAGCICLCMAFVVLNVTLSALCHFCTGYACLLVINLCLLLRCAHCHSTPIALCSLSLCAHCDAVTAVTRYWPSLCPPLPCTGRHSAHHCPVLAVTLPTIALYWLSLCPPLPCTGCHSAHRLSPSNPSTVLFSGSL